MGYGFVLHWHKIDHIFHSVCAQLEIPNISSSIGALIIGFFFFLVFSNSIWRMHYYANDSWFVHMSVRHFWTTELKIVFDSIRFRCHWIEINSNWERRNEKIREPFCGQLNPSYECLAVILGFYLDSKSFMNHWLNGRTILPLSHSM